MNWKKIGTYKILGAIPGIGLVSVIFGEVKKRKEKPFPYYNLRKKEDWKAIGKLSFQAIYLSAAISCKLLIGYYVQQGISTKEWNPFKQRKAKTEQSEELEKENKLEKTIKYEDFHPKDL